MQEIYAKGEGESIPEIECVNCDTIAMTMCRVGTNGVTRIELYNENGQMSYVPWIAVYKGDFLWQRFDAAGMRIYYKEFHT